MTSTREAVTLQSSWQRQQLMRTLLVILTLIALLGGWALVERGEAEEGIRQMRRGFADIRSTGSGMAQTYFLALLAEGYRGTDRPEEGLKVLSEAFDLMEKTSERTYESRLHRHKGDLLLALSADSTLEAESSYRRAIKIASRQQAKSLELQAVTSLSRLLQKQGKKEEAKKLLSETYSWFTEGFDTADLKEAKTLLESLE
jgi:predicted ATPase